MGFFVEVGSCDFDTCEQLIKNGWKGLVIEPVKFYFDKLPRYDTIIYENIAIDSKNGQSVIHYIDPKHIKDIAKWEKGISSLLSSGGPLSYSSNQKIHRFKNPLKQVVQTYTLNRICEKHNIKNIDFLKIDTEGHDLKVLKSIDLNNINVKMIKLEHKHLVAADIINHLKQYNYLIYQEKDDIYAIK